MLFRSRSSAANTGKLKDSPYNGFAFKLDGKLITVTSPAIDAAQTYGELRDAIEAAVKANPDLSNKFTVSLGSTYSVSDTLGTPQEGQEIVLTNITGGVIDASSAGTGWLANGAVPASSGLHTNMSTLAQKTTDKVTARVCKFLGDISYPLYMVHYPFIYLYYAWVKNGDLTFRESLPGALALFFGSVILAWLCLRLYDEPVRKFLSKHLLRKG